MYLPYCLCCWGHPETFEKSTMKNIQDFWWHPFVGAEASNGESLNRIFGGDTIVERGARLSQKMFPIFNLHSALSSISSKCRSLPKGRVAMSENIVVKERSLLLSPQNIFKHRKNCECCPGHSLTISHLASMSWFLNLSGIVSKSQLILCSCW